MQNMKRILLVSNMYPSKKYPHYGVFVRNTEKLLLKNGKKLKKIVLKKTDNQVIKVFFYFWFYVKIVLSGTFGNYDYIYGHFASHISMPLLIIKKIKKRRKIVLNVHGNDIVADSLKDFKNQKKSKKILKKVDIVVAPSLYFKSILQNEYNIENNKIVVYPSSGVDKNIFFPLNQNFARKKIGLNSQCKYIGYVGRIETNKGWDIFLKAAKIIIESYDSPIKFIVVGDGDEKDSFNELVRELSITEHIIYYSMMDQDKLRLLYNSLDIFCFPTYRKSESLGLVGLEAMACKTIVVASKNYGPTSYIIHKKNGFFFDPQNTDDLVNAVLNIFKLSNEDKEEIKKNAYSTADKYEMNNIKNILLSIFE